MSIVIATTSVPNLLPVPRAPVIVRPATPADLPFIDGLQKRHTKQVGWMPTQQLEGKVRAGHVLVADGARAEPVGYCIASDRYMKRDDVGIVYQMNVAPGRQRGLIGATLLKAVFDRAAYGCRLFCCWCAQDIEANRFWESMGFVPLAFRSGSRGKGRTHIFWQRRIRAGDTTTPYWFPSQTSSGSIREDRLVLPIPPHTHWSDAKPIVLPGSENNAGRLAGDGAKALPSPRRSPRAVPPEVRVVKSTIGEIRTGGLRFVAPPDPTAEAKARTNAKRERKPAAKNDPRLVAAARELRDRYLEQFNSGRFSPGGGKYDVTRAERGPELEDTRALLLPDPSTAASDAAA